MTIESQIFIACGKWRNYEHLEEELSLDELTELAKALYDEKDNNRKFMAALQGIDLYANEQQSEDDIADLQGYRAELEGFGVGQGLGYEVEE